MTNGMAAFEKFGFTASTASCCDALFCGVTTEVLMAFQE
jgi:hypothetical protein